MRMPVTRTQWAPRAYQIIQCPFVGSTAFSGTIFPGISSRLAFPFSHVAAAPLHSSADSSPLWTVLAQICSKSDCGRADVFLEESACFLFGRAAPDSCASSILLQRDAMLCSEAALAQPDIFCSIEDIRASAHSRRELSGCRLIPRGQV